MQIILPLSELDPGVDMIALMAELDEALTMVSGCVFESPRFEQPQETQQPDPNLQNLPAAGTQRQAVLLALLSNPGGLTPDEVVDIVGCANSAVDGRVLELLDGGFITRSDERRPTPYGGQARVLFATEKARLKVKLASDKWLAGNPRPEGC